MEPVVIGFDHVAKRYGSVQALSEISFEVPRGSVLSLLGPNGAGKTSCVRILATLTRPDAGRVVVGGHDVRTAPDSVRRLIGMVGQHPAVDDRLTGRENLILLGRLTGSRGAAARARAADLLEQFGLASAADRTVRTYSGGMRRRIDLAAALVHKPAVLLLDEPSAGLDPSARAQLWQLVREVVGFGTTVLLTTQYLEEADNLADRVLVLDGGRVGADGTPDELKARFGRAVIQVQFPDPALLDAYVRVLDPLGDLSWPPSRDRIELRISGQGSLLIAVVRDLDRAGLQPAEVWSRPPTLDDVFLALTQSAPTPVAAR